MNNVKTNSRCVSQKITTTTSVAMIKAINTQTIPTISSNNASNNRSRSSSHSTKNNSTRFSTISPNVLNIREMVDHISSLMGGVVSTVYRRPASTPINNPKPNANPAAIPMDSYGC